MRMPTNPSGNPFSSKPLTDPFSSSRNDPFAPKKELVRRSPPPEPLYVEPPSFHFEKPQHIKHPLPFHPGQLHNHNPSRRGWNPQPPHSKHRPHLPPVDGSIDLVLMDSVPLNAHTFTKGCQTPSSWIKDDEMSLIEKRMKKIEEKKRTVEEEEARILLTKKAYDRDIWKTKAESAETYVQKLKSELIDQKTEFEDASINLREKHAATVSLLKKEAKEREEELLVRIALLEKKTKQHDKEREHYVGEVSKFHEEQIKSLQQQAAKREKQFAQERASFSTKAQQELQNAFDDGEERMSEVQSQLKVHLQKNRELSDTCAKLELEIQALKSNPRIVALKELEHRLRELEERQKTSDSFLLARSERARMEAEKKLHNAKLQFSTVIQQKNDQLRQFRKELSVLLSELAEYKAKE
ncbi:hypothetical protein ADUPG1_012611 [Aduncisulcus paluster]|uniref:Uncharacterized protein n=1 Tax=Aduncisulcus paluster TaxID=2918883 RepID=A0ABQ5K487_9EUKA|nr:hypothetical protein ADUPG1_012611 [Aduncisulcus paluster]